MDASEARKAKLLLIKNEISSLKAQKDSFASFGCVQSVFAIVPIFWPILYAQRRIMNTALNHQKEQIQNALDVWRDDLGSDFFNLSQELDSLVQ